VTSQICKFKERSGLTQFDELLSSTASAFLILRLWYFFEDDNWPNPNSLGILFLLFVCMFFFIGWQFCGEKNVVWGNLVKYPPYLPWRKIALWIFLFNWHFSLLSDASVPVPYAKRYPRSGIIIDGFTYHQNTVKKDSSMR
jgi:hypothetical protein